MRSGFVVCLLAGEFMNLEGKIPRWGPTMEGGEQKSIISYIMITSFMDQTMLLHLVLCFKSMYISEWQAQIQFAS